MYRIKINNKASTPLAEVRVLSRTAARAHFEVISKAARLFLLCSDQYRVACITNTDFFNWKQSKEEKSNGNVLQHIEIHVAGVSPKTA